ncbi:hypothetical protein FOPG_20082 [Fusarium oxysporum f. sp. conglutinans race 2 54008]|uniref:Uncharacterized protein n=1 Tax=Fusarium oxysporum f. sp. conglutinans race 2 54008 TaxID=1089457 RepID=X0HQY8_FUSOX|nr:hypothetical protein FOPG_20082 [Fusarium oxysporum f. sp. conglutinans race 2 54008]EXL63645.1 hypothetical protein FOPG_20082 [Fusarium oxysporum f. sp. conglutinans race 2 54008]
MSPAAHMLTTSRPLLAAGVSTLVGIPWTSLTINGGSDHLCLPLLPLLTLIPFLALFLITSCSRSLTAKQPDDYQRDYSRKWSAPKPCIFSRTLQCPTSTKSSRKAETHALGGRARCAQGTARQSPIHQAQIL